VKLTITNLQHVRILFMTTKDHQTFLVWDYSTTKKLNYGFTMRVIHRKAFMGSQGMVME
jgi:hypothetical protein